MNESPFEELLKNTLEKYFIAPQRPLTELLIKRVEDIGVIKEKLNNLLRNELFEHTSKYDPTWLHHDEKTSETLHQLRMQISFFHDELQQVYDIADYES